MKKKSFAIVVGGGPAPGINGVISAVAIEAIKQGHAVWGIQRGFSKIMEGEEDSFRRLRILDVSRIHGEGGSVLGTSRANPTKDPRHLENVIYLLKEKNVGYLVTIGGDDTATTAMAVSEASDRGMSVVHVPKTIDNDLPLAEGVSTFGYQSARHIGTKITEALMVDAKTTGRWYLVIAMGRKAGHLALGIGVSSGATLTVIPEEFKERPLSLEKLVDILVGSMLKRLANGQPYGVAVLAEGLAEILDMESIEELKGLDRDPHGNIRFREFDFGRMLRDRIRVRLKDLGIDLTVVDKNVGYELRCCPPIPFDREYTRALGYSAVEFLLGGGDRAMISLDKDGFTPVDFAEFFDPESGRAKIRLVDTKAYSYQVARRYMIRLESSDLENDEFMKSILSLVLVSKSQLVNQFLSSVLERGE